MMRDLRDVMQAERRRQAGLAAANQRNLDGLERAVGETEQLRRQLAEARAKGERAANAAATAAAVAVVEPACTVCADWERKLRSLKAVLASTRKSRDQARAETLGERQKLRQARAGQMVLEMALIQSALQLSVVHIMSSALDMSCGSVLCRPCPKESFRPVETTPTAHFERRVFRCVWVRCCRPSPP